MHNPIRILALQAFFCQRQQNLLGEDEAVCEVDVRLHTIWIDEKLLDDLGELCEHIVEEDAAIRDDHPFDR